MAGDSNSEKAVDAFVSRAQESLDCVLNGVVFGSGNAEGHEHTLVFYAIGQPIANLARLSTHGGTGEIRFRMEQLYRAVPVSEEADTRSFTIDTIFYQYRILDFAENEIVVYDWAPFGRSPVRTPHLHVPAAGSLILAQRPGSTVGRRRTFLGSLHLPSGRIVLEDIVELLIREFQVVPRRDDWAFVLARNRTAVSAAG